MIRNLILAFWSCVAIAAAADTYKINVRVTADSQVDGEQLTSYMRNELRTINDVEVRA
jgi:hypothetical protein